MNKKVFSFICAIFTSLLWGSAFVAQDMGMDFIGPHTFNVGRFLVGFLTLLPFFLFYELKKIKKKKFQCKEGFILFDSFRVYIRCRSSVTANFTNIY